MASPNFFDDLLACPSCRGPLQSRPDQYQCLQCRTAYGVKNLIPRFLTSLSDDEQQVRRSFNLEHARFLKSRHLHFTPTLVEQWLAATKLPAEYFKGKVVLDAGCGSGRWSYAMAVLGATVVAVDFTEEGARITSRATAGMENVAVLQANIQRLPFRPGTFDLVVSWGVLHHTPDTRAAFERLVPLIKPGGSGYIMVYEKHNPVKFACTNILRRILQRFPEDVRYRFCRHLIIWNPVVHLLIKHVLLSDTRYKVTDPLEISTKQLGLYDAYAPVFNHLHTREEVMSWFAASRFTDITLTSPVRFTRPLDVFRWGACGGAVSVRGVRA
jgi:2-polyprenyl-3-methyl-5-hydroxy-6-metoxy-1,4-benzoquinol methylase